MTAYGRVGLMALSGGWNKWRSVGADGTARGAHGKRPHEIQPDGDRRQAGRAAARAPEERRDAAQGRDGAQLRAAREGHRRGGVHQRLGDRLPTGYIAPAMKANVLASTPARRSWRNRRGDVQGARRAWRIHIPLQLPRPLPERHEGRADSEVGREHGYVGRPFRAGIGHRRRGRRREGERAPPEAPRADLLGLRSLIAPPLTWGAATARIRTPHPAELFGDDWDAAKPPHPSSGSRRLSGPTESPPFSVALNHVSFALGLRPEKSPSPYGYGATGPQSTCSAAARHTSCCLQRRRRRTSRRFSSHTAGDSSESSAGPSGGQ